MVESVRPWSKQGYLEVQGLLLSQTVQLTVEASESRVDGADAEARLGDDADADVMEWPDTLKDKTLLGDHDVVATQPSSSDLGESSHVLPSWVEVLVEAGPYLPLSTFQPNLSRFCLLFFQPNLGRFCHPFDTETTTQLIPTHPKPKRVLRAEPSGAYVRPWVEGEAVTPPVDVWLSRRIVVKVTAASEEGVARRVIIKVGRCRLTPG